MERKKGNDITLKSVQEVGIRDLVMKPLVWHELSRAIRHARDGDAA